MTDNEDRPSSSGPTEQQESQGQPSQPTSSDAPVPLSPDRTSPAQQPTANRHQPPSQHPPYPGPPGGSQGAFDMTSMAHSVPRTSYGPAQYRGPPGYRPGTTGQQGVYGHAVHAAPPYPGQHVMMHPFYGQPQSPSGVHPYYGMVPAGMAGMTGMTGMGAPGYFYYAQAQPVGYFYAQQGPYPGDRNPAGQLQHVMHAIRPNFGPAQRQRRRSQSAGAPSGVVDGSTHRLVPAPLARQGKPNTAVRRGAEDQRALGSHHARPATVVRGPSRKPKQSGHAVWIGNLPPQTDLMDLVHHVCQYTTGLQSLFLISKSNCAFANFPSEASCVEAQQQLNDTWFKTVRLLSRLRKSTVDTAQGIVASVGPPPSLTPPLNAAGPFASTMEAELTARLGTTGSVATGAGPGGLGGLGGPSKSVSPGHLVVDGSGGRTQSPSWSGSGTTSVAGTSLGTPGTPLGTPGTPSGTAGRDKYFILKSLTIEDLDLSVRTGIWATQSHNEEALNAAFQSCENVYLIFSANKSGEYYGFARMTSEINNDPSAAVEVAPTSHSFGGVDAPQATPTEATETTPRGRIVDDSARGTIFWEAQTDDGRAADDVADTAEATDTTDTADTADATDTVDTADATDTTDTADVRSELGGAPGDDEPKAWGKPFHLEWLSTSRLPFYRTRGLRNPLNGNREVKIARDGTEVDADVGRELMSLILHASSPGVGSPTPDDGWQK